MIEFTDANNQSRFASLKERLDSAPRIIQVFRGIRLPASTCSPCEVRLGFSAIPQGDSFGYTVYIDRITYTGSNYMFRQWVIDGDWAFPSFDDVVTFFHTQLKNL